MRGAKGPFPTEPAGGRQETPEETRLRRESFRESKKEIKALTDLSDLLVGKLDALLSDAKNGIPLQGFCDFCPDKKITIKDS